MLINRRLSILAIMATVHEMGLAAPANNTRLQDMVATGDKFKILNAQVQSTEKFFVETGNNKEKLLKMEDQAGYSLLSNDPAWKASGFPTPNSVNGRARVGNGQCVDFVKLVTGTTSVSASTWIKGDAVSEYWDGSKLVGKVIATFDKNGKYDSGHVAIVLSAWNQNNSNTVTNVYVVDANYVPNRGSTVARHGIDVTGRNNVSNLKNYYTVKYYKQ